MTKAHEDADNMWRRVVRSELGPLRKRSGATKKRQRFGGMKTIAKTTILKGRASAVKYE